MKILVWIGLILSFSRAFAGSPFDSCVSGLYGQGGLSLREAQEYCLHDHDPAMVSCQNNLFQKAFLTPQDSFSTCTENKNADISYRAGDLYHGQYQAVPFADGKKTVCTITVNSEEERQSFQKFLPATAYNFLELLPQPEADRFITRDSQWLQRSCENQVRCDILVISGHFADSFLGDKGFEISMTDLQTFKQKAECQNFFESIKEVYLFGCNTLASKNADARSISEYVNVLIGDGVAPHTAQRIAARRYTPYDQSVAEKMKDIFSSANFITGFTTVGPSGKSVQPTLEKYLSTAYVNGQKEEGREQDFTKTLGRLGMDMVKPDPKMKSLSGTYVPVTVHMTSTESVTKFINQYGASLPVPVVDVVNSALAQGLLKKDAVDKIKASLTSKWQAFSATQKRRLLCPLILAENENWLPNDIDCKSSIAWMSADILTPTRP